MFEKKQETFHDNAIKELHQNQFIGKLATEQTLKTQDSDKTEEV